MSEFKHTDQLMHTAFPNCNLEKEREQIHKMANICAIQSKIDLQYIWNYELALKKIKDCIKNN